ncbi:unnamed protein product, partial [Brassica rapa]
LAHTEKHIVITYMKSNDFVKEMRIHYKLNGHAKEEAYEKFLLHLRTLGPVAVGFNNFPNYSLDDFGFHILSPTPIELVRPGFEYNYTKHVALLMRLGIDVEGNEYVELFEISGHNWRDSGFVQLAMHQGLTNFAIEMEI